jgi:hypothetical protein
VPGSSFGFVADRLERRPWEALLCGVAKKAVEDFAFQRGGAPAASP